MGHTERKLRLESWLPTFLLFLVRLLSLCPCQLGELNIQRQALPQYDHTVCSRHQCRPGTALHSEHTYPKPLLHLTLVILWTVNHARALSWHKKDLRGETSNSGAGFLSLAKCPKEYELQDTSISMLVMGACVPHPPTHTPKIIFLLKP